ncbi:alginate export family protein [Sphingomonas sp. CJ20]
MKRVTTGRARSRWCGAAAMLFAAPAAAQTGARPDDASDALTISASVRVRYESIAGQVRPGFPEHEDLVAIRTTLAAEYHAGPVRIGGELYDSRVYDADPNGVVSANDVNTFEPVQAYAALDLDAPFGAKSSATVQVGRFMLNIGSRRLIAADDYRNTTSGYTGVRTDLTLAGGVSATLLYVLPQTRLPEDRDDVVHNRWALDRESGDTRLWGGMVTKDRAFGATSIELGYFGFKERDAPGVATRDRHLQNIDVRVLREPAPRAWDYEVEGIYQFGSARAGTAAGAVEQQVAAWFGHADLGYTLAGGWKPRLSVEGDYASGDGPGGDNGRFDTLYGMRRADLAPSGIYSAIGRANIATLGLRTEVTPSKRNDGFLAYRLMWLADRTDSFATSGVRDATGRSGSFAGHQIEGRFRQWIVPTRLRGEFNGAWLLKRGVLRNAPNAPHTPDSLYLSFAVLLTL